MVGKGRRERESERVGPGLVGENEEEREEFPTGRSLRCGPREKLIRPVSGTGQTGFLQETRSS